MRRILRVVVGLVVVLLVVGAAGWLWVRRSLPQVRGTVALAGLHDPVEVVRDHNDVPHIFAHSQEDAVFALGFVHAQDRLWQMDFQRRLGAGRLSEVLGGAALDTDRFLRTLGVYRVAQASLEHLGAHSLGLVDAYVAGVNAYVAGHRGPWPPEYLLLGVAPQPFTPADVVVWSKMMSWDLSGNWDDELLRARLIAALEPADPSALVATLWPPYPGDAPVVVPDFQAWFRRLDLSGSWASAYPPEPPGAGSNDWVLAGSHTASGAPLLANDPHLGLGAPSLWYLAQLSAPGLDVIGATLPGTPAVLLGRNERIAWGFTNTGPDTQDLFMERVDPSDPTRYLTPEGSERFGMRREVIRVKGADDVTLTVRSTRHGPVVSDAGAEAAAVATGGGTGLVLALEWTALREQDVTLQAVLRMNTAGDWDSFTSALRDFGSPQQNIVYADVDGAIGYYAPGRIPIRRSGDGTVPVPGWSGAYDWAGWIPFEALPHALDPADGRIVTANNKVVPDDYPYYLTRDWSEPYRVERIRTLLAGLPQATMDDMAGVQRDQVSLMARAFLPTLTAVTPRDEASAAALAQVRGWDGHMARDGAAPLIFAAWYRALSRRVYADDLGDLFDAYFGFHPLFLGSVLDGTAAPPPGAEGGAEAWCDDVRTPGIEGCAQQASTALADAVARLSTAYGADPTRWRWGRAHRAHSSHPVFTGTPLRPLFDLSIANGGGAFTVDAARFDMTDDAHPFRQTAGPGFRAVYDLSRLDGGWAIQSTGQSGNPLSRHYRDFVRRWRDGQSVPLSLRREDAERGAIGTLVLAPAAP